jgi:hypothetical protein
LPFLVRCRASDAFSSIQLLSCSEA